MGEHDQRFKQLLKEFFREFLRLFFALQTAGLDSSRITWLDKELFPDPPQGDVYFLDLVAQLARLPTGSDTEPTLALVHVEVESRESVQPFRKRIYDYYHFLRRTHNLPVLPLAVFMRVGLDGLGIDTYVESWGDLEIVRFQFPYAGLPALDAATYLSGDNWLGVALAALMRMERGQKPRLRAELLRRLLVECQENDYRKLLLMECAEAYLGLDESQQQQFQKILQEERFREVQPMMTTTFEKGVQAGRLQGQREVLHLQLQQRFGPLSETVLRRLEAWPADRFSELIAGVLSAKSLRELGLED